MPFLTPLNVQLLNDRAELPWITLSPLVYDSPLTGETYEVPKHFRTDGASIPKALIAIPALALRYFGEGVWQGFKQGVLHDYLRRTNVVPPYVAHAVFREALYDADYPPDLCETYYAAVKAFNS
ncbi:DUF1353 domain-containing protein [Immundisolibacter sp.]